MFIDIACNITCENLLANIKEILDECKKNDVMPLFVGLDVESSLKCLELSKMYNTCCFQGIHPNHIDESKIDEYENLNEVFDYDDERVAGIGECGLDYYRSKNRLSQLDVFRKHISIYNLPYFYHCRNSADFTCISTTNLQPNSVPVIDSQITDLQNTSPPTAGTQNNSVSVTDSQTVNSQTFEKESNKAFDDFCRIAHPNGVVHSFDGTIEEAEILLSMGFYIGINGCSLKTLENIEVVRRIPLNRILLETDSPYCQIRKSHASSQFVDIDKSKYNTPINIKKVAEAVSKIKNVTMEEIESTVYENTIRLFPRVEKYTSYWRSK